MNKKLLSAVLSVGVFATALPAMAASAPSAAKISCVSNAVNTRESALVSAISTYTQSVNSAYSARAAALQQAYSQTPGQSVIKKAVRSAWATFSAAMKSARSGWQSARKSAWATFGSAVKACKAPTVATDAGNAGAEASGN